MKLPNVLLHHHHHLLPRRVLAVPFSLSLSTRVKGQNLSPRLLQLRFSSSTGSDDVDFRKIVHRLIDAQKAVDYVQSKGDVTIRGVIQRAKTMAPEERRPLIHQYFDADHERFKTTIKMFMKEALRLDTSDSTQMQRLRGPDKNTKVAQLVLDRAAEPSHRITPNDLKLLEKALLHVASRGEKVFTRMKVVGFTLGAYLMYYVYTNMNRSP